jgi:hypothetical protein
MTDTERIEMLEAELMRVRLEREVSELAASSGLRKEATEDLFARLYCHFKVTDGKLASPSGMSVEAFVAELKTSAPHLFDSVAPPKAKGGASVYDGITNPWKKTTLEHLS